MIGVIADPADQDVVREFFELFKTPWEFYRENRGYEVVLCAGDSELHGTGSVILCYSSKETSLDSAETVSLAPCKRDFCMLSYQGKRIPIYGESITFKRRDGGFLTDEGSGESAAYLQQFEGRVLARVGYDLFREVRTLLKTGQPATNASIPTLERHITLPRDLIIGCGVPLKEIPPIPQGHSFIACLTHDVDHPSIRPHKWDHTAFGFLYRAVFGSLRNVLRGRLSFSNLIRNWVAALKLPLVHLHFAEDFWRDFDDRYLELETGLSSTFFVIPFKNCPGKIVDGAAPGFRAAHYDARDLANTIEKLQTSGHEIALHGIDAWLDSSKGAEEIAEIRRLTGTSEIGTRMHWLYYDELSPKVLEQAGASYDSTVGYNETVGYRAGTSQVYRPPEASRLLELPMHVMDTALFYPAHLDLSANDAKARLNGLLDNVVQYGGCLTVNWHDRSLAPERLWGNSYRDLVHEMKARGAWFANAGQAIAWFRKRRSVVFGEDSASQGVPPTRGAARSDDGIPGLRLRVYKAGRVGDLGARHAAEYVDFPVEEGLFVDMPSEIPQ